MPEMYQPFAQRPSPAMVAMIRTAVIRARSPPRCGMWLHRSIETCRSRVWPQETKIAGTLNSRRFATLLLVIFAGLALTLSAVGVYGLLNYWVTAREEEIAIRLALGARRSGIFRWAGAAASKLMAAGVVLGVVAGLGGLAFAGRAGLRRLAARHYHIDRRRAGGDSDCCAQRRVSFGARHWGERGGQTRAPAIVVNHVGQVVLTQVVLTVANLRADCQSARTARVNNPRAGWHPAPRPKFR